MKKLTALLLILMLTALSAPALAEIPPMTTEEITLVFGTWNTGDEAHQAVLDRSIAAFCARYPNITVEVMPMSSGTFDSDMLNMAAAGTLPDVYILSRVPDAVANGWALNITEYLDGDPEAADVMQSYRAVARVRGGDYAIPAYSYPYVCVVNTTMLEKYNVDLPDADWTWEDYCEIGEELAHYEDFNFGLGGHGLYRWYLALTDGLSSYGWDGESYHFTDAWVESLIMQADWRADHVWEGFDTQEDMIAAVGSTSVWIPGAGVIGLFTDYSWGCSAFLKFYSRKTGQNFVLYPQPLGDTNNAMAAVDYCAVSPSCEYPREAYELSKWLVWGEQACMERVAYFTETGTEYIPWHPTITTQSVWDAFAEHASDRIKLFDSVREYVAEAHYVAPNYLALDAWLWENDIITGIMSGSVDGYAILDELNDVAQSLVDEYYDNLILDD